MEEIKLYLDEDVRPLLAENQDAISHILRRLLKLMANNSFENAKGQLFWLSNFENGV